MLNPKKIFFIDNAIVSRIGFNATDNMGVKLENIVFIELKRRGYDVFIMQIRRSATLLLGRA